MVRCAPSFSSIELVLYQFELCHNKLIHGQLCTCLFVIFRANNALFACQIELPCFCPAEVNLSIALVAILYFSCSVLVILQHWAMQERIMSFSKLKLRTTISFVG